MQHVRHVGAEGHGVYAVRDARDIPFVAVDHLEAHVHACLLAAPGMAEDPEKLGRDVLLLINNTAESHQFILPPIAGAA